MEIESTQTTSSTSTATTSRRRTGEVVVERVGGRSTLATCFSKYPLKFIVPNKAGPSKVDAVWIYSLTYGGGIVSFNREETVVVMEKVFQGDTISCKFSIRDGCTAVFTTQASTKVYKSLESKCSQQLLEAEIGSNAFFVVIPDPVTCFSTARYLQKQVFTVMSDSNLVIVDWITSGRHETGEKWEFHLYKSTNNINLPDNQPLFLDTVLLEQGGITPLAERMQDYQVIAMVILLGPKLRPMQYHVQENVQKMMSDQLRVPSSSLNHHIKSKNVSEKPAFIASCSSFGPKASGLVVRIASTTTESVYRFLQHQLAGLEPLLGVSPYC